LGSFAHGLTDVAQSIREAFEFARVGCDVHVSLNQVAKLSFKVDGTVELIIAELGMDGAPDFVGEGFGGAHDGADIFGHGVVKPAADAVISHGPVGIVAICGGGCDSEVGGEPKLANEGVKELSPFGIVGLRETKFDGNMMADIDGL
jgi:hypothetical protein